MRRTATDTRAMAIAGVSGTAAGESKIGSITLPAEGPWNIIYAWGFVVQATMVAAELAGGSFIFRASSGDVDPNMSPFKIPSSYAGSNLGTLIDCQVSPLILHPCQLAASGKAIIECVYDQHIAITTANQVLMGLIFGHDVVESDIPTNYDQVNSAITAAAATSVGTITIPETASKIVSITALLAQDGIITAGEELLGFISLSSDDVKLPPAQFPASGAFSAGLGATIGNPVAVSPVHIPLDIPIPGGARIDIALDLNTAVTNAAGISVVLGYK